MEELPDPSWCAAPAPPDINVYTDGSLKNPTNQDYSLGGFGIYDARDNCRLTPKAMTCQRGEDHGTVVGSLIND